MCEILNKTEKEFPQFSVSFPEGTCLALVFKHFNKHIHFFEQSNCKENIIPKSMKERIVYNFCHIYD